MGKRARSCTSTEPDCVPTELDEDSSDQDINEVTVINDDDEGKGKGKGKGNDKGNIPNDLAPYIHWGGMARKYVKCLEASQPGHRILLDLCPPNADIECHIAFSLDAILSTRRNRDHSFKFGVSSQPGVRWTAFPDYKYLDTMLLVVTSERSDLTASWEIKSISNFRNDARLQNRKPGGENAHCGVSPHFLYIVFGMPYQFERGRMLSRA